MDDTKVYGSPSFDCVGAFGLPTEHDFSFAEPQLHSSIAFAPPKEDVNSERICLKLDKNHVIVDAYMG